jgi:anaerobic ribonucleoside-triphosphate reductase activating protein
LQPANTGTSLEWSALRSWLDRRRGLLDAVVFSGGEPTAQTGLRRALQEVREMGFQAGLHTAGIYPRRLKRLLPLLDWIGFDVKAESLNYESITGVRGSGGAAIRSLDLVLESGIACEMRTTVHPDLLSAESLWRVAESLARRGARHFVVQEFRAAGCMDGVLRERAASGYLVPGQLRDMARLFTTFEVRRS